MPWRGLPRRPDQRHEPAERPGIIPGGRAGILRARVVIVSGPGNGLFVYRGSPPASLASSDVGMATTDPLFGRTVPAGYATYNAFGAVTSLLSADKSAFFQYNDNVSAVQGSRILSIASVAGTDPVTGTGYGIGLVGTDPVFGGQISVVGATIDFAAGASFSQTAEVKANPGAGAVSPNLSLSAPEQSVSGHLVMLMQGTSPDGTHLGQFLIARVATGFTLPVPVTSALIEFQSPTTGLADALLQLITAAAGVAGDNMLGLRVSGDTFNRLRVNADGSIKWGPGNAGQDVTLARTGAAAATLTGALSVSALLTALAGLSVTGGATADTVAVSGAGGARFKVTETAGAPAAPPSQFISLTAGDRSIGLEVTGDTNFRLRIDSNGRLDWSSGTAGPDVALLRSAANTLQLLTADLDIATAGRGLQIKEGANARMGTAILVAGTVTVANTTITAATRILLTAQVLGGTQGILRVAGRVAGTSFTITSSNAADTSTVAWLLIEPG